MLVSLKIEKGRGGTLWQIANLGRGKGWVVAWALGKIENIGCCSKTKKITKENMET